MLRLLLALAIVVPLWSADDQPLKPGDFVLQWRLRGPFPKPDSSLPIGNEADFAREPHCDSEWKAVTLDPGRFGDNFHEYLGAGENCFAYAVALIDSPADQDAKLMLGSDDGFTVWLNGEIVGADMEVGRGVNIDEDRIKIGLRKGRNVVMLKVAQGVGGWGFCVRFSGLEKPVSNPVLP